MLFMVYPQMVPSKGPPPQIVQPGGAGGGGASGLTPQQLQLQQMQQLQGGAGGAAGGPMFLGAGAGGPSSVGGHVSTATAANKAEVYDPKLFGFRVNEAAKLKRWREANRDRCVKRRHRRLACFIG